MEKAIFFNKILFSVTALIIFCVPCWTYAYPPYNSNSDLVISGPYDTSASGVGNWGSTSVNARDFIIVGQKYRIRKTGTIQRIRMYTDSTQDLTSFYIMVWRKDGTTYDLVGMSENLVGNLVSGNYSTIDLSNPITGVQEGDFYGGRMEWSSPHNSFYARTGLDSVTSYFYNGQSTATDFPWEIKSTAVGSAMPIEFYMTAPQAVFIGDSIIMGATEHTSYLSSTIESAPETTIEKHLYDLTGYTYQNMGIGSQRTADILARFNADVIALKPQLVVIDGGVNDIAGSVLKSTFIANWTSILDAIQADSNIKKVAILKILPWTNGTNTQMQTRDDWNSSLVSLANNYSKAVVVDASSYVGQNRVGGDANNLWDIIPAYNADGVHFNSNGHLQIATAIKDALDLIPAKVISFSPSNNSEAVSVDSDLVITFDNIVDAQSGSNNDIEIVKSSDDSVVETIDAQSANIGGNGTAVITINPTNDLLANENYYIKIGSNSFKGRGATNYAGISNNSTWTFRTVDTNGSTISSLTPVDNGTNISISTNLTINFNEIVEVKAGTNNDIKILKLADDSIVETIDAQSANVSGGGTDTITINPSINLEPNTSYYITIGADAFDDESGNSFAGISDSSTWTFRTQNFIGEYGFRKSITISNTNISSTLTDFPLLVKITSDSDIGSNVRNDGYDIVFTNSLNVPLSYERESWSGGAGSPASGTFWVKTNLNEDNSVSTSDTIYIYYGKASSSDNQDVTDGVNDVWNSSYAGIWHLAENSVDEQVVANKHNDSTINAKDGNQNGNVQVTGTISYGQGFDGVDDNVTMSSAGYTSQDISVSWWSKCSVVTPVAEGLFDVNRGASDRMFAYHWSISGQNGLYVAYRDGSATTNYVRVLDASITQSDWHHFVAVWNEVARTFTLYKDGTAQVTNVAGSPTIPSGTNTRLGIGANATEGNVSIDEFRIASSSLSASWIKFEYENMASATNELSWGSQTTNSILPDTTAPSAVSAPSFGTITANSIEITKPSSVTETGSGLYEWQVRRDGSVALDYNLISSNSFVDTGLSPNTSYSFDVRFKDQSYNVGSYGSADSKFTLANTPTSLSFEFSGGNLSVTSDILTNDSSGDSGYYFSKLGGGNSGWIRTNTWIDNNVFCGQTNYYSVKFRNADGVESPTYTTSRRNDSCSSTGSSIRRSSPYPVQNVKILNKSEMEKNSVFLKPIFYGTKSDDVKRLQKVLSALPEIYPEAIVSGYFGPLTERAIQRFQLKYSLVKTTSDSAYGYFGPKTRAKIAEIFYR